MLLAAVAAMIAIAAGFAFGDSAARAVEPAPPNVIVIMSDDQAPGDDAGAADRHAATSARAGPRSRTRSPAIRSAVPSRATLLTGEYAHNHGTHRQQPAQRRRLPGADRPRPDPRRLAAGVRLRRPRFAGKWLNGLRTPHRRAAGLGPVVGADRRGRRRPLVVLRLRPLRAGRQPAPLRHRDRATTRPTRSRATTRCRSSTPGASTRARSSSGSPTTRRTSGSAATTPRAAAARTARPTARASKQSAIPPPRYARRYRTGAGAAPALVRRARRRRQAEAGRAATRPFRATTSRRSSATTAAGSRRCGRSTTAVGQIVDRLRAHRPARRTR